MSIEQPRFNRVQCLSPAGLHAMAYVEWGDPQNEQVLVCVHGLTRVGRDFDRLAAALSDRYRVVCPDVVGRGLSDRLRDPGYYGVPQYVSDMVSLIARTGAARVDWVGTSLGGLIGMALAGQPGSQIRKLVLNDVGPRIDAGALRRIGEYLGASVSFDSFEQAVDYIAAISAPFGLRSRDEWREITLHVVREEDGRWVRVYDPGIAVPFKAITPEAAAAGERAMWALYDSISAPTLVIRGENSDLLSRATVAEMQARGPRPSAVEIAGVGHAPMLMHADQIAIVRHFLLDEFE